MRAGIAAVRTGRGQGEARDVAAKRAETCLAATPGPSPTLCVHVGSFRDADRVEPAEAPRIVAAMSANGEARPQLAFDVDHLVAAWQLASRWVAQRGERALVVAADRRVRADVSGSGVANAAAAVVLAPTDRPGGFQSFYRFPAIQRPATSDLNWDAGDARHALSVAPPPDARAAAHAAGAVTDLIARLGLSPGDLRVCATQRGPEVVGALRAAFPDACVPRVADELEPLHSAGPLFAFESAEGESRGHVLFVTVTNAGSTHVAYYRNEAPCRVSS